MRSMGIVLFCTTGNSGPAKILDASGGVVGGFMSRTDVCVGSCIEYMVQKKSLKTFFEEIDIIFWPTVSTVDELLLLHQAIEICLCCMPQDSFTDGVFEHIFFLYNQRDWRSNAKALLKKIFLCKLFSLLGLYPEDERFHNNFFEQLTTKSFDKLWCQTVIISDEKEVDEWLRRCVATHVPAFKVKAMSMDKLIGVL